MELVGGSQSAMIGIVHRQRTKVTPLSDTSDRLVHSERCRQVTERRVALDITPYGNLTRHNLNCRDPRQFGARPVTRADVTCGRSGT